MDKNLNKPSDGNNSASPRQPGPDMSHGPGPELMGAGTLIGDDVYNTKGEALGDIKEIMLDTMSGTAVYAVVAVGGFLGMGNKLFAIPWKSLKLDETRKRFTLDISKERMQDAPGFDKDHWPDMADDNWNKEIRNFYGVSQH